MLDSPIAIWTLVVTDFQQNARVLCDPSSQCAAVIDPGGNIGDILRTIDAVAAQCGGPIRVESILLTHSHIDHAGGVAELLESLTTGGDRRPLLYAHPMERMLRSTILQQAMMFGLSGGGYRNCPEPDVLLEGGMEIKVGEISLRCLFTPGHSPGHVSFFMAGGVERELYDAMMVGTEVRMQPAQRVSAPILFGGDALFRGSVGRTDLPGGSWEELENSIRRELFTLPDETVVLSGHGEPTLIGVEKRTNPFFQ